MKWLDQIAYIGPDPDAGPLPAVFYFALSAEESLKTDPYNQCVLPFLDHSIRVFSLNLPVHGPGLNPVDALSVWAQNYSQGTDLLEPFIQSTVDAILHLEKRNLILKDKIGFMGLSRGCLISGQVAAKLAWPLKGIVGFAPLTSLSYMREFKHLETAEKWNLVHRSLELCTIPHRFYIGNHDTRVGTRNCFNLTQALADTAFQKGVRSPPIELIIGPSIGHMGHGTSKQIFTAGASWLLEKIA